MFSVPCFVLFLISFCDPMNTGLVLIISLGENPIDWLKVLSFLFVCFCSNSYLVARICSVKWEEGLLILGKINYEKGMPCLIKQYLTFVN